MARKSSRSVPSSTGKSNARRLRAAERRKERSVGKEDYGDLTWVKSAGLKIIAAKIVNGDKSRPYWLSIPHGESDGIEPVAPYLPCSSHRTSDRTYYGFLFKEHRDATAIEWEDARRETTENAMNAIQRK